MCGIIGVIAPHVQGHELPTRLQSMAQALQHRGPDDFGFWHNPVQGVGLSHRRLSVVDLSPAGHQPMRSASGRYVITFNGEIYNHRSIRETLEQDGLVGAPWRGHADTETLLAAVEAWGLAGALQRCVGMFALALWDGERRVLQLARDRFGEKPLYWGVSGSASNRALIFGSELAALRAWPGFTNPIDRPALAQLMRFGAIAAPNCIYTNIQQLLPGHLVTIPAANCFGRYEPQPWWCFRSMLGESLADPFGDPAAGLIELEAVLSRAVQQQSLADVPLGSFLSGGIDSSLITALLQAQSSRPVRTLSLIHI